MKQLKKLLFRDKFALKLLVYLLVLGLAYGWLLFDIKPLKTAAEEVGAMNHTPEAQIALFWADSPQKPWVYKMVECESSFNPNAINPKDSDGTASFGILQFKPPTFRYFVMKYNLFNWREWEEADWRNALMSDTHQLIVFKKMISDPEVNLKKQFPACIKKNGYPPKTGNIGGSALPKWA